MKIDLYLRKETIMDLFAYAQIGDIAVANHFGIHMLEYGQSTITLII